MSANVLILRTANYGIMDKLIDYIISNYNNCNIYMIVQENALNNFKIKYGFINYIIMQNDKFNCSSLKKDKKLISQISDLKFQIVFMPSSVNNFIGFYDAFKFLSYLGIKRVQLFNNNCKTLEKDVYISFKVDVANKIVKILNKITEIKIKISYFVNINKNIWK